MLKLALLAIFLAGEAFAQTPATQPAPSPPAATTAEPPAQASPPGDIPLGGAPLGAT